MFVRVELCNEICHPVAIDVIRTCFDKCVCETAVDFLPKFVFGKAGLLHFCGHFVQYLLTNFSNATRMNEFCLEIWFSWNLFHLLHLCRKTHIRQALSVKVISVLTTAVAKSDGEQLSFVMCALKNDLHEHCSNWKKNKEFWIGFASFVCEYEI